MISEIGLNNIGPVFRVMDSVSNLNTAGLGEYKKIPIDANTTYVKYCSRKSMYDILESDSLYLFCSELSNDKQENQFLKRSDPLEAYISCFYNSHSSIHTQNSSDVYSQWLGYCRDGGASFEFYFYQDKLSGLFNKSTLDFQNFIKDNKELFDLSLITASNQSPSEYVKYSAFPFRVQYYDEGIFKESLGNDGTYLEKSNTFLQSIRGVIQQYKTNEDIVAPYFKHSGFVQESEARLAIVNYDTQISKCVNYLKNSSGARIPYINAKFGDSDKTMRPCVMLNKDGQNIFENSESVEKYIRAIPVYKRKRQFPIIIPQGRNQEEMYLIVETVVSDMEKNDKGSFSIICQGHLPITKITLAPTTDRSEQRKMMEIFCKGRYWLRHVEISESKIPYNTNNINHT